eukprot:TRINITY_DN1103_c0_g1_i1.p2 TRINITY_DN1103_c0_g1~~TRINITY_DN1103_c0_g1_i1.p2  ORF type:complete len:217 (+),score=24.46 TRINITY_DN1103_c0_g1_i1:26-676(+)
MKIETRKGEEWSNKRAFYIILSLFTQVLQFPGYLFWFQKCISIHSRLLLATNLSPDSLLCLEPIVLNSQLPKKHQLIRSTSLDDEDDELFAPLYLRLGGERVAENLVIRFFQQLQNSVLGDILANKSKIQILRERRAVLQQVLGVPGKSVGHERTMALSFLVSDHKVDALLAFEVLKDVFLSVVDDYFVDFATYRQAAEVLDNMKPALLAKSKARK